MIGAGTQMLVIALSVFMLSLVGMFYPYNRGAMLSACVVLYALTAGISGRLSVNTAMWALADTVIDPWFGEFGVLLSLMGDTLLLWHSPSCRSV